jgi:hypothetical protein
MVMIKDNHISVAGGIANAMRFVDQFLQKEKLNSCRGRYFFTDAHVDKDKPMCLGINISVVHLLCLNSILCGSPSLINDKHTFVFFGRLEM